MTHKKSSLNSLIIRAILFAFISSTLVVTVMTAIWGSQTLTTFLKRDSESNSKVIFASMQALMNKGTTQAELQQYVDRLNAFYPDKSIKLNTTDFVPSNQIWTIDLGNAIQINYPVKIEQSCIACHQSYKVGQQKASIEYIYPIKEVFFSLGDVITLLATFAFIGFMVIFGVAFFYIHHWVVRPLQEMTAFMDKVNSHQDLVVIAESTPISELEAIRLAFNRMANDLSQSFTDVLSSAETDELTQLRNRRNYENMFKQELLNAQNTNENMALVMLDLNHFKPINDTFGHQTGDQALIHFAQTLKKSFRRSDFIFRVGGDEFALILPNISAEAATQILTNLNKNLTASPFLTPDHQALLMTCSMGFAIYPLDGKSPEQLMAVADKMMYLEKEKVHKLNLTTPS